MLSFRHFRAALFAMLAVAVLALAACSDKPAFKNLDITGSKSFGTDFSLTDHTGKRRTLEDFRGKVVVMFFGYTHCPDVCPTTLQQISDVLAALGPKADRLKVAFVSVDPERDTPASLKTYLSSFDPRIVGLTGSPEQVAATVKTFRAYAKKVPGSSGDYTMEHTALVYLMDARNGFVGAVNLNRPAAETAAELSSTSSRRQAPAAVGAVQAG